LQDALQAVCQDSRVLVICDEHHHAAVEAVWGDSVDSAFASAKFVLVLTVSSDIETSLLDRLAHRSEWRKYVLGQFASKCAFPLAGNIVEYNKVSSNLHCTAGAYPRQPGGTGGFALTVPA